MVIAVRRENLNEAFARTSFLDGANATYIEDLYERFQENPGSVTADWRAFFTDLKERKDRVLAETAGPSWKPAVPSPASVVTAPSGPMRRMADGHNLKAPPEQRMGWVGYLDLFRVRRRVLEGGINLVGRWRGQPRGQGAGSRLGLGAG